MGQLKSTLQCSECKGTSVTFDPFWDICLPIPSLKQLKKLHVCSQFSLSLSLSLLVWLTTYTYHYGQIGIGRQTRNIKVLLLRSHVALLSIPGHLLSSLEWLYSRIHSGRSTRWWRKTGEFYHWRPLPTIYLAKFNLHLAGMCKLSQSSAVH